MAAIARAIYPYKEKLDGQNVFFNSNYAADVIKCYGHPIPVNIDSITFMS